MTNQAPRTEAEQLISAARSRTANYERTTDRATATATTAVAAAILDVADAIRAANNTLAITTGDEPPPSPADGPLDRPEQIVEAARYMARHTTARRARVFTACADHIEDVHQQLADDHNTTTGSRLMLHTSEGSSDAPHLVHAVRRPDSEVIAGLQQQAAQLMVERDQARAQLDALTDEPSRAVAGDWLLLHVEDPPEHITVHSHSYRLFGPFRTADDAQTWATNTGTAGQWLPIRLTQAEQ